MATETLMIGEKGISNEPEIKPSTTRGRKRNLRLVILLVLLAVLLILYVVFLVLFILCKVGASTTEKEGDNVEVISINSIL